MDIAQYIAGFLLKNQFCYLHGLGNLELRRKPASYDGEALQGPQYTVALTRGGSIDDNLAAYIAHGEQTSISKAANALREFSTQTRAELAAGNDVALPGVGRFTMRGGAIDFVSDETLAYTPPSIPVIKNAKRLEEQPVFSTITNTPAQPAPDADRAAPSIAWGKVALLVLLLAGIGAAGYFGWKYLTAPEDSEPAPVAASTPVPVDTPAATQPTAPDSLQAQPAADAQPVQQAPGEMRIVLNTYTTRARADQRVRFLRSTAMGDVATVRAVDSTRYEVTLPYAGAATDTTRVLDSLSRVYGGRAVMAR